MKNLTSLEKACTIFFIILGAIIMCLFFHNLYLLVLPLFKALSFSPEGLFISFMMLVLAVVIAMLSKEIYLTAKTFNS